MTTLLGSSIKTVLSALVSKKLKVFFPSTDKEKQVYVKFKEGDSNIGVRSVATVMDGDIDMLAQMHINLEMRKQWDGTFSSMRIVQSFSENEDLIHHEMKMPFPITNRDFVHYRYYINSQSHGEELDKLGIPRGNGRFWLLMLQTVEYDQIPAGKGVLRAEDTSVMIFEEDKDNPKKVSITLISATDLKGSIPLMALQYSVGKQAGKLLEHFISSFRKNREKWSKQFPKK